MTVPITVVVPAYNEAERILPMLIEIEEFIKERKWFFIKTVIVVDDGSRDATVERAMSRSTRLPLRVERLVKNTGKWAAIRRGIELADTDAVLILDADGSASIYELDGNRIDQSFELRRAVFGTRFDSKSKVEGKSGFRSFISWGYRVYVHFWYFFATGRYGPQDFQCPWKLIYKSRLKSLPVVDRFSGDIDLACRIRGPIISMPVHFIHKGGSKVKTATIWDMAVETAKVGWNNRFRKTDSRGQ